MRIVWIVVYRIARMWLVFEQIRSKNIEKSITNQWAVGISNVPIFKIQPTPTTSTEIIFQFASLMHNLKW